MLLPPVIVDLGPEVGAREAQIVLEACNHAIANGVCLPEAADRGADPPRAIAVARAADRRVLVVRIEVRLQPETAGSAIVRELEFGRRDPLRERWRSVGLAIATLVGEGEQRARDDEAANEPDLANELAPAAARPDPGGPPPAAPARPAPPAAPASPAPPSAPAAARRANDTPERVERDAGVRAGGQGERAERAELDAGDELDDTRPFERRPLFIGLGVLTGPGFGAGAWRAGGNLRAAWHGISGWQLATSLGLAWRTSEESFTAAWVTLEAGAGYRLVVDDAFSVGTLVFAGAQRARFEVLAAGESRAETRYNPRFGLGIDARWRASASFGAWASAEGSSTGRETHLFIAPDRDPVSSYPVEVALFLGVGWWPE
jgi:hypothetical protein